MAPRTSSKGLSDSVSPDEQVMYFLRYNVYRMNNVYHNVNQQWMQNLVILFIYVHLMYCLFLIFFNTAMLIISINTNL